MSMDDHVPDNPLTYRLALAFDQYCAEREGNLSSQPLRRELVALYDEVSKALLLASADLIVRMPDENGEWGERSLPVGMTSLIVWTAGDFWTFWNKVRRSASRLPSKARWSGSPSGWPDG